jgi:hypothetical protein
MAITWTALRCLYLAIGGLLAPALLTRLLIRDRGGEALGNPALAFIAALGTVILWPALLALALEDQ